MFPSPYERQEGESGQAYAAFCLYRDLGPSRSMDAAYLKGREKAGKGGNSGGQKKAVPGQWWRWSAEHEWKRRAESFDQEREREERETAAELRRLEVETYRAAVVENARRRAEAADAMLQKAMNRLAEVDVSKIPVTALPNFLKAATSVWVMATQMEGIALGLSDEAGQPIDDEL